MNTTRDTPSSVLSTSPPASKTSPKTILIAEHAGYCHGVEKAVNKTLAVGEREKLGQGESQIGKPVYVLGHLIHNQQVIDHLSDNGITTVQSLDEIPSGSVCVIRTHGSPPELLDQAKEKGIAVADATCPDVRLVQNKAIQLAEEGYTVVVVGKAEHPEVIGIMAHSKRVPGTHIVAINKTEDLAQALEGLPKRRIGVVSQTTQMEETFFETVKAVSKIAKEMKVFNTICPATFYRQNSALDLSKRVDFMVVVGGKNSSNTTHLAEICHEQGTPTIHVETYKELDAVRSQLMDVGTIGVTAGASTPDWLITEVVDYLKAL